MEGGGLQRSRRVEEDGWNKRLGGSLGMRGSRRSVPGLPVLRKGYEAPDGEFSGKWGSGGKWGNVPKLANTTVQVVPKAAREVKEKKEVVVPHSPVLPVQKEARADAKWVLWYDPGNGKVDKRRYQQTEKTFLSDLKTAGTFRTAAGLQDHLARVRDSKDVDLTQYFSLYVFRNGIKPLWEHPKNINGGSFSYITCDNTREGAFKLWLRICADALSGRFDLGPKCRELNGIAISIDRASTSKYSYYIKISVWNENCRAKGFIEMLRNVLEKEFFHITLAYRKHQTRIQRNKRREDTHHAALAPAPGATHNDGDAAQQGAAAASAAAAESESTAPAPAPRVPSPDSAPNSPASKDVRAASLSEPRVEPPMKATSGADQTSEVILIKDNTVAAARPAVNIPAVGGRQPILVAILTYVLYFLALLAFPVL